MKKSIIVSSFIVTMGLCMSACTITQDNSLAVEPIVYETPKKEVTSLTETPATEITNENPTETPEEEATEWYTSKVSDYNSKGILIKETEYDQKGNITSETIYDDDGKLVNRYIYDYYENGDLAKNVQYGSNNEVLIVKEYPIDEKGRKMPMHYEYYDADGELGSWTEGAWDDNDSDKYIQNYYGFGKLSMISEYEFNGKSMVKCVEKDLDGNVEKETEYWSNGISKKITSYFSHGEWGEITLSVEEYNEDGKELSINQYNAEGEVMFESETEYKNEDGSEKVYQDGTYGGSEMWLDSDGHITMKKKWDENGQITDWEEIEYDEYGEIKHSDSINPEDESRSVSCETNYDDEGMKHIYSYMEDGSLYEYREIVFNENHKPLHETSWKVSGNDSTVIYDITTAYDKYGNRTGTETYVGYTDSIEHSVYENMPIQ